MSRCILIVTLLLSSAVVLLPSRLPGQTEDTSSQSRPTSPLRRLIEASLKSCEITSAENKKPMTARVALRWTNNTRGSEDGATVLFLEDGIPHAVCSIYPWEQRLHLELDSVSRAGLLGQINGAAIWRPATAGVEYRPVPDEEAPGSSPAIRLRQMKALAGKFSSTMLGWKSDKSDREPLRLLPQPLYRYETTATGSCFDGAVFAFVQGTDPEALLLMEAVRKGNIERWEYAFVRQTSGELEGRFQDAIVWHQDPYPISDQPQGTHFTHTVPLPVDVLESLK